jgi:hypothetical protein
MDEIEIEPQINIHTHSIPSIFVSDIPLPATVDFIDKPIDHNYELRSRQSHQSHQTHQTHSIQQHIHKYPKPEEFKDVKSDSIDHTNNTNNTQQGDEDHSMQFVNPDKWFFMSKRIRRFFKRNPWCKGIAMTLLAIICVAIVFIIYIRLFFGSNPIIRFHNYNERDIQNNHVHDIAEIMEDYLYNNKADTCISTLEIGKFFYHITIRLKRECSETDKINKKCFLHIIHPTIRYSNYTVDNKPSYDKVIAKPEVSIYCAVAKTDKALFGDIFVTDNREYLHHLSNFDKTTQNIPRHTHVIVEFYDEHFTHHTMSFTATNARCIQHYMDVFHGHWHCD